jgi:hypothetical protein
MESSEPETGDHVPHVRQFLEAESGQEWVAKVAGRSTSGVLPLRVIPLMEVTFSKVEAPEVALSRAISPGESLEELDDASLVSLLKSSGPMKSKGPSRPGTSKDDRRGRSRKGPRR